MQALVVPISLNEKPYLIDLGCSELDTYHKVIGCNCIDTCVLAKIGHRYTIDAVVDDRGLLDGKPMNQRFERACNQRYCYFSLAGTVVIVMTDRITGETVSMNMDSVRNTLVNWYGFDSSDFEEDDDEYEDDNRIYSYEDAMKREYETWG